MKRILLLIVLLSVLSCKQKITEADISNLNGYWELEKVELPDGDKKEYKVNETIDFFKIKDEKGFRKKVMPQLDGTYLTNDIQEDIEDIAEDEDDEDHNERAKNVMLKSNVSSNKNDIKALREMISNLQQQLEDLKSEDEATADENTPEN